MSHATEAFWLLTDPFEEYPDVRFLVPTRPVRTAIGQLRDALAAQPGWLAVLGEAGVGKSVLTRLFAEAWANERPIAVASDAALAFAELSDEVCEQLQDVAGGSLTREALCEAERAGRRPVIVLDRAEELPERTLRDIEASWSATNSAGSPTLLVDLVAVVRRSPDDGAPDWLRQRGARVIALEPLAAEDTASYVKRRIRLAAGGEREIFDPGALDEVQRRTAGLPDAVNRVCALTLDRVALAGGRHVGSREVADAAALLGDLPVAVRDALGTADIDGSACLDGDIEEIGEVDRAGLARTAEQLAPATRPAPGPAPRPTTDQLLEQDEIDPEPLPAARPGEPAPVREITVRRTSPWIVALAALVGAVIGAGGTLYLSGRLPGDEGDGWSRALPHVETPPPPAVSPPSPADAPAPSPATAPPDTAKPPPPAAPSPAAERASTAPVAVVAALAPTAGTATRPLPPVDAPPPSAAAPAPLAASGSTRVALPLEQGAPTLERALVSLVPPGSAWRVELIDLRSGEPVRVERVELAHDEIDGRLHTLGAVAGEGERRAARVLDRGEDPTGAEARVFWPEERRVRPLGADDPLAGTGFRFADFRARRAAEFEVTGFAGDEIAGAPVFVVSARPLTPPDHDRIEITIAERDEQVLEVRWYDAQAEAPVRRLVVPHEPPSGENGDTRDGTWRLFGAAGDEIARAYVEVSELPADAGPDLFTFSRIVGPDFTLPRR